MKFDLSLLRFNAPENDVEDDFVFGDPNYKEKEEKVIVEKEEQEAEQTELKEDDAKNKDLKALEDESKPEEKNKDSNIGKIDDIDNEKEDVENIDSQDDNIKEEAEETDQQKSEEASFFVDEVIDETKDEPKQIDFLGISKKIGIEFDQGESPNEDLFLDKINKLIENSKQEFKLDGYSAPAKNLINHLNKTGDISSYFLDEKVVNYQQFLALDADDKYWQVRSAELSREGKSEEDIEATVQEELSSLSTRQIKDLNDRYDAHIKGLLENRVSEISKVGEAEYEKQMEVAREKIEKEKTSLKNFISSQSDVLGIKLTEKDKQALSKMVDNGDMDLVLDKNPEKAKFYAYMHLKFPDKINGNIQRQTAESIKKAKNQATDKFMDTLHETNELKTSGTSGRSPKNSSERFASWANEPL